MTEEQLKKELELSRAVAKIERQYTERLEAALTVANEKLDKLEKASAKLATERAVIQEKLSQVLSILGTLTSEKKK